MTWPIHRHPTRMVHVGNVAVGGNAPIAVQSMTNTDTRDVAATTAQIRRLSDAGCEIVRVAVPDIEAADAIRPIRDQIDIPLIADIHFDYRLAIASAEAGADGLRINPGNIGGDRKVRAVADCVKAHHIPIRIGVNAGSLEKRLMAAHGGATTTALVASAMEQASRLEAMGVDAIKLSVKASDVPRTVTAYRELAAATDHPLHVGVTEAGGRIAGVVKSSLGIGMLLAEGVGDTLRVSLTRDPVEEVQTAYEILRALDIRHRGPEIISCPTCGRCGIDLFSVADAVEKALVGSTAAIKVAIMGCPVNGPGEAREADIGIAGDRKGGILFKKGEVVRSVPQDQLVDVLVNAVRDFETEATDVAKNDRTHR